MKPFKFIKQSNKCEIPIWLLFCGLQIFNIFKYPLYLNEIYVHPTTIIQQTERDEVLRTWRHDNNPPRFPKLPVP